MSYYLIFLTGLTTGGLTCLAVQGGLLASAIIEDSDSGSSSKKRINKLRAIIIFLAGKLVVYSLLGLLIGALGQVLALTPRVFGVLNIFIALFMLGVALETLKVHPVFRYFLLQPPKFIRKKIKTASKNKGDFAALTLGLLTVFIPCGTTQAMMALAATDGTPLKGFLTLFFFILGTIPVFFVLGYFASTISDKYQKIFKRIIAILLIGIAIYTFTNGLKMLGVTLSRPSEPQTYTAIQTDNSIQRITIKLNDDSGYNPASIKIKKDIPVEITLTSDGAKGCIRSFVIPSLNKQTVVTALGNATITFTPTKTGTIPFTCPMGMYSGEFIVE